MDETQKLRPNAWHRMRLYIIWESLLVGTACGAIIAPARFLIHTISHHILHMMGDAHRDPIIFAAVVALLSLFGAVIHLCLRKEPLIGGNLIPPVNLESGDVLEGMWRRVLPLKFIGSVLTLSSGVTMGMEGPSVQLGAFVGQAIGEKLRRPWTECRQLITAGISGGLAAAFHAPLTGIVYSMEIVRENFSRATLIPAMLSAFTADYLVSHLFHTYPVIFFRTPPDLPLSSYWMILVLATFVGISGSIFHLALPPLRRAIEHLSLPLWAQHLIPVMLSGLVCIPFPVLFSAGEPIVSFPLLSNPSIGRVALILLGNYVLMLYACASGLPGGVFFPVLVLGSLAGNLIGQVFMAAGWLLPDHLLFFTLIAMAGHFAAVVRAPLTAIVLVVEMTGSFIMLLPLGIVAVASSLISRYIVLSCSPDPDAHPHEARLDAE